jgi:hypothetical protein
MAIAFEMLGISHGSAGVPATDPQKKDGVPLWAISHGCVAT